MKTTKRVLSVLLALALGVALVVSAGAIWILNAPYAPIITLLPQMPDIINVGDKLILEVEAELPEGVDGELSYAWYKHFDPPAHNNPISTESKLELTVTSNMLTRIGSSYYFPLTVVAINTYTNENNEVRFAYACEDWKINVNYEGPWWAKGLEGLVGMLPQFTLLNNIFDFLFGSAIWGSIFVGFLFMPLFLLFGLV
jgi:hypothetical protein